MYPRVKLLAEQITLGLNDPYDRIIELLKYGKESNSLDAYTLRYGDAEGLKRFNKKVSKTKQTLEKYIKKYGEENGPLKYKEYCKSKSMSLDMCIKRYGEIEGPIKYKKFWDNTSFGTTKEAFKKRHGEDWEIHFNEFRFNNGWNNTLEAKIIKYGEEDGLRRYRDINQKKSKSSKKDVYVKKLLDSGYSFNEIQNMILDRWSHTSLRAFISRYGEKEGNLKYTEYVKKMRKNNPLCLEYYEERNISKETALEIITEMTWERNKKTSRFSKESLIYLDKLNDILTKRGHQCLYKYDELGLRLTKDEYDLYQKNKFFFYDFYVPDLNLIVEYHGVRFHSDIDYESTLLVNGDEIKNVEYNRDFYKKWLAEQRGYKVFIIRSWFINEDLQRLFEELNFTEEEKCKLI